MARFLALYANDRGERTARLIDAPNHDEIPTGLTAEALGIDDLGADDLDYFVQLPDGDFRPEVIDPESGDEVGFTFGTI